MTEQAQIIPLLESCIELELRAAALYECFAACCPQDCTFWAQLRLEERNHAALCRAALDSFSRRGILPGGILPASAAQLRRAGERLDAVLSRCRVDPPTRHAACRIAVKLENDMGEQHFNAFMNQQPESGIERVLQQLNRGDKDHAERIELHLQQLPEEARQENAVR